MKSVAGWMMDELLEASVLARHGISLHTRCNYAMHHYLTLKQALDTTCPLDDVERTLVDPESWLDACESSAR